MRRRIADTCTRPEFWLLLLLAWVSISAFRSAHTLWAKAAFTEWLRWGAGIGLALILGQWLTRTRLAARFLVVCTGILTAIGVGNGLVAWHDGLTGPFRDHQLFGSALLVLLPMTLAVGLTAREPRWQWGARCIAFTGLLCLVLTETRSAWISAAAAGGVFAFLWWRRTHIRTERNPIKQLLVPLLLAVIVSAYFVVSLSGAQRQQPLSQRAGTLTAFRQDRSWQARLSAWHGAERMVADRPLLGWGLGRYPGMQWRFTHVGRILSPDQHPSLSEQAHDFYLQTAAETGVIGLALYLAVLTAFIGRSLPVLRRAKGQPVRSRDGFLVATLALIAGMAVDSFASPSYQFAEISLFAWVALGVGISALNGNEAAETEASVLPAPVRRLTRLVTSGALSLVLLSQFVPLGLLTPVAAYAPPSGWKFVSIAVSGTQATANVGDTVYYTLQATYQDADGVDHYPDVTTDSTANYSAFALPSSVPNGTFNVDPADNVVSYTVPESARGLNLTIAGSFRDGALKHTASTMLQVSP